MKRLHLNTLQNITLKPPTHHLHLAIEFISLTIQTNPVWVKIEKSCYPLMMMMITPNNLGKHSDQPSFQWEKSGSAKGVSDKNLILCKLNRGSCAPLHSTVCSRWIQRMKSIYPISLCPLLFTPWNKVELFSWWFLQKPAQLQGMNGKKIFFIHSFIHYYA